MTIHIDGIDDFHHSKIDELKEALGKELLDATPLFNDDFSLLRWLVAWNYKIDDIVPKYKKVSNMMKCLKLNNLPEIEDIDEINMYTPNILPAAKYFPSGIMGFDQEGNIVFMHTMGKVCPKELFKCGKASNLFYLALVDVALIYKLLKRQEIKYKKKLGVKMIIDLEGWNMDLLYMPCVKLYKSLIRLIQDVFPDLGVILLVINAPSMINIIYPIFKPAFAEETRKKVVFAPKDYKSKLISEIGAENVFEKWGGTKIPKNGSPTGSLNIGGLPPDSLIYDPAKNPYHIDNSNLNKINIVARQKSEINIHVEKTGAVIRWFFWTSGEIEFNIEYDGHEVWPKFRLSTEFVPEYGSIECEHSGTYSLIFDNTFSTFFSKDVKFKAYVE